MNHKVQKNNGNEACYTMFSDLQRRRVNNRSEDRPKGRKTANFYHTQKEGKYWRTAAKEVRGCNNRKTI